ncbi:uncharacterized protein LOC125673407 isoform X2 [Ostrea edulis]|uniref:uncharacterized protein LOC125673407 isoform X2 n=1 Tax=Ostrea edulis TaxID=37623 RepID=UPI002095A27E|nr:uncharacterized protein LOC125673407 isoform X2 [Ostrea edulis]
MRKSSYFALFSATLCVYFSVQISSVTAKCKGPWANHMCFGGNGKRSWSPPPPEVEDKRADEFGRTVLRNVLLKRFNSFEPEDKYYSDSDRFYPMDSEFREEGDSGVKNDYLRELLQEQLLRREMAALTEDDQYV